MYKCNTRQKLAITWYDTSFSYDIINRFLLTYLSPMVRLKRDYSVFRVARTTKSSTAENESDDIRHLPALLTGLIFGLLWRKGGLSGLQPPAMLWCYRDWRTAITTIMMALSDSKVPLKPEPIFEYGFYSSLWYSSVWRGGGGMTYETDNIFRYKQIKSYHQGSRGRQEVGEMNLIRLSSHDVIRIYLILVWV